MVKNKKLLISAVIIVLLLLLGVVAYQIKRNQSYMITVEDIADSFPLRAVPVKSNPQLVSSDGPYAVIHTTAGDITILLYPEQAPKAVENFISLAEEGYYDGSDFYFVKKDDIAQAGKPMAGNPAAETIELPDGEIPRYALERSKWDEPFDDEFDDGLHNFTGAVAMAGSAYGANQNQSQFYFIVRDEKPAEELIPSAYFYMNELITVRLNSFREKYKEATASEAEIKEFEDSLNEEIASIGEGDNAGIPKEFLERYKPAVEQYMKVGGMPSLDYKATVFGQIVDGFNIAKAITQVKVDPSTRSPKKDVIIESIEIKESYGN